MTPNAGCELLAMQSSRNDVMVSSSRNGSEALTQRKCVNSSGCRNERISTMGSSIVADRSSRCTNRTPWLLQSERNSGSYPAKNVGWWQRANFVRRMSVKVVPARGRSILFGHRWLSVRPKEKMATSVVGGLFIPVILLSAPIKLVNNNAQ